VLTAWSLVSGLIQGRLLVLACVLTGTYQWSVLGFFCSDLVGPIQPN
jgi:hypothetical protein